jgi:hypothetical protein
VHANIEQHKPTMAKHRLPGAVGHDTGRFYKAFVIMRNLDVDVDRN